MGQITLTPSDTIRCMIGKVEEPHETLPDLLHNFTSQWDGTSTIQALLFIICAYAAYRAMRCKNVRRHIMNHLMRYACAVFAIGFALYVIGFNWEGSECNTIALALRAATASVEMFVSESELIEVAEEAKADPWYMAIFAITHFLAICISAAFILHIMGIRSTSYIKMSLARKKKKEVFVFFDLSQESINLAKDIHKTVKDSHQIIFVKTPMEESHLERFSFSHIMSFADNKNETIEQLIAIDAFLTYSRRSVTIEMDENEWKYTVGLNTLRRYLKHCTGKKYFFCLSSNADNNINTAVTLSRRYQDKELHHIYCRASHDSITESLSDLNLRFIDSASLAVLALKENVAYQPVSFVKPDTKTGVATKPFKSMIVGFGETGCEVFKFLYEFSALVGSDGKENPFFCDIIDPKAKLLEARLHMQCPALRLASSQDKGLRQQIRFHEGTIESNASAITELIRDLDYIVVCTANDKENLSMGITLLNLAYQHRSSTDRLSIFVSTNDNNEYKKAQEIARFYETCGKKDKDGSAYDFAIIPFGARETLFTYKNIISDTALDKAKSFYYEYQKTSGLLDVKSKSDRAEDKDKEWKGRRDKKPSTGESGLCNKNELTQQEFQDMANVWHIKTKLYLAGACSKAPDEKDSQVTAEARRTALYGCIDTAMRNLIAKIEEIRNDKSINDRYKRIDSYLYIQTQIREYEREHGITNGEYQTLFDNLAKCEHMRWVASNCMLGYRTFVNARGNEKRYLKKTLACMVPNEAMLADADLRDTIKYDYNTILVSLRG